MNEEIGDQEILQAQEFVVLRARVKELEVELNDAYGRLNSEANYSKLILSQLEIATDLGQKRWMALNEIVEHANQKSADWCRRIAKEGLGLK